MTSSNRTALRFYFCSELRLRVHFLPGCRTNSPMTNVCHALPAEIKIPNTRVTVSRLVTWKLLAGHSPEFTWNLEPAKRTGSRTAQIENRGCDWLTAAQNLSHASSVLADGT